ncbi:MAG: hypothetical protein JNM33_06770 [Rubrivivax sp.]|nr:hypothetical protein [Rubrivivax sp.]
MTRMKRCMAAALLTFTCVAACAGPSALALGKCLTDNTSGKERKALARWIFIAMAAHPEIKQLSAATPDDLEQASRATGALFTRLLAESCPAEMRAALQNEGAQAMQSAFSTLGQVAMQELMTDASVNAAIAGFERFVDGKRLEAIGSPR